LTYREQFKIGRRNLLDLLNAFNELYQAESAVVAARVDLVLTRLQIEYAAGKLVPVFEQGS
ncbi:MAG: TolC family protein, partial [Burkholderiaceae bacterium]